MALYPEERLNEISLCTGYHGIGLGLRLVEPRHRTVCMVERELFASGNLAQKMQLGLLDEAPIWDNLETFDGRPWAGRVDLITGGIPCQPWSVAGQKKGVEDRRWIWESVYRIIREVRPRYIFLEEVAGFISAGLPIVVSDLTEVGYCVTWDCFRASDMGAPHQRERLFILAKLADSESVGRGGGQDSDGDDGRGLQEREADEWSVLWSEVARRSRDFRGDELGDSGYAESSAGRSGAEGSVCESRDESASSGGDIVCGEGEEVEVRSMADSAGGEDNGRKTGVMGSSVQEGGCLDTSSDAGGTDGRAEELADSDNDGRASGGKGRRPRVLGAERKSKKGTGNKQAVSSEHSCEGREELGDPAGVRLCGCDQTAVGAKSCCATGGLFESEGTGCAGSDEGVADTDLSGLQGHGQSGECGDELPAGASGEGPRVYGDDRAEQSELADSQDGKQPQQQEGDNGGTSEPPRKKRSKSGASGGSGGRNSSKGSKQQRGASSEVSGDVPDTDSRRSQVERTEQQADGAGQPSQERPSIDGSRLREFLRGYGFWSESDGEIPDLSEIWPARPGQQQWWWEPPRVITDGATEFLRPDVGTDASRDGCGGGLADNEGGATSALHDGCGGEESGEYGVSLQHRGEDGVDGDAGTQDGEIESEMERDSDGAADRLGLCVKSRIDELRLIGNGVVPMVSAVAWFILKSRMCGFMQSDKFRKGIK